MADLKEFLRKQAEEQREHSPTREAIRADWVSAVEQLIDRMAEWVRENDVGNALKVDFTSHQIHERRIGRYVVKGLLISLPSREVRIEPIARFSIGSYVGDAFGSTIRDGRVDMSNGTRKYMLYRTAGGRPDQWVIVDDRSYDAKDFDRPAFEEALLSMLQ